MIAPRTALVKRKPRMVQSGYMRKKLSFIRRNIQLPVFVEKDEDGFFVVECPILEGCYSQGKTLDKALANIREVIRLAAEDKKLRKTLAAYQPREFSVHAITL